MQEKGPIFSNNSLLTVPKNDEIDIILFGAGSGESILIHIGDSKYVVIDSFLDVNTKQPICFKYLDAIGVPKDSVELVVCTHWHQDHTEGLYQIVKEAGECFFSTSNIIAEEKFHHYISLGKESGGSTTKEFANILSAIESSENAIKFKSAQHNQMIYNLLAKDNSFDKDIKIYTLSPQHSEVLDYIKNLNIPEAGTSTYKFPYDNDISIVVWLEIGDEVFLFGADLQNVADSQKGWKAVLKNHTLNKKCVNVFKVPHHGSENGYNKDIVKDFLADDPISILSVFNRSKIPNSGDKDRIKNYSSKVFIAGTVTGTQRTRTDKKMKNRIKDYNTDISLFEINEKIGFVRLRKKIDAANWVVDKFGCVEEFI